METASSQAALATCPPLHTFDPSVVLMPGAYVEPGVQLAAEVHVGANAAVLADAAGHKAPASVARGARIGANATVLPGVAIGTRAQVAPGAVVTRSVPPLAIVEGNPARIVGYVETRGPKAHAAAALPPGTQTQVLPTHVAGVTLHHLKTVSDLRGNLSAAEFEKDVPFAVKRYFLVFDVPTSETRGEHAHRKCKQFLVAVRGSVKVVADDGRNREEFILDRPHLGLYLPPMTWGVQYEYYADSMLLVFASHYYDAGDYIRDYATFIDSCHFQQRSLQL